MRILDASYEALREFAEADDRQGTEALLDEIAAVEARRLFRQWQDSEARRRNTSPEPWIPQPRVFC